VIRIQSLLKVYLVRHSFTKFADDSSFTFRLISNEQNKDYNERAEVEIHFPWLLMAEDDARLEQVLMILDEGSEPIAEIMGHIAFEPYAEKRAEELKKIACGRLIEVGKDLKSVFSWSAKIQ